MKTPVRVWFDKYVKHIALHICWNHRCYHYETFNVKYQRTNCTINGYKMNFWLQTNQDIPHLSWTPDPLCWRTCNFEETSFEWFGSKWTMRRIPGRTYRAVKMCPFGFILRSVWQKNNTTYSIKRHTWIIKWDQLCI